MFECVWNTLKSFSLNDKELGGVPGAVAVLHTHSRELNFHPHIHIVMPAGTIDKGKRLWSKKSVITSSNFARKTLARAL